MKRALRHHNKRKYLKGGGQKSPPWIKSFRFPQFLSFSLLRRFRSRLFFWGGKKKKIVRIPFVVPSHHQTIFLPSPSLPSPLMAPSFKILMSSFLASSRTGRRTTKTFGFGGQIPVTRQGRKEAKIKKFRGFFFSRSLSLTSLTHLRSRQS